MLKRLEFGVKATVQCLYQCTFRREERIRDRAEFNIRLHPVRDSLTWYDAAGAYESSL